MRAPESSRMTSRMFEPKREKVEQARSGSSVLRLKEEEGEDPVVEEYDVYMSHVAGEGDDESKLYVIQYPHRPANRPYGEREHLNEISYRKQHHTLQFSYEHEVESENFDCSHHTAYTKNEGDGADYEDANNYEPWQHKLNSCSASLDLKCSYAAGFFKDGKFFLTPVDNIHQMRSVPHAAANPYVSTSEAGEAAAEKDETMKEKGRSDTEEKTPLVPSAPSAQQPYTPRVNNQRPQRIQPSQQRAAEMAEPWVPLKQMHHKGSAEATSDLNALINSSVCYRDEDDNAIGEQKILQEVQFDPRVNLYLDALCSTDGAKLPEREAATGKLSYLSLHKLPIQAQLTRIMQHLHVVSIATIKRIITLNFPDDTLLIKELKSVANIALGNWVAKSELIYQKDFDRACRDLLVLLLIGGHKGGGGITKEPFINATNTSKERASDMFKQLATLQGAAWFFKIEPDSEFLKDFARECQAADAWWKQRQPALVKLITEQRRKQTDQASN